jgi:hypothetical protein
LGRRSLELRSGVLRLLVLRSLLSSFLGHLLLVRSLLLLILRSLGLVVSLLLLKDWLSIGRLHCVGRLEASLRCSAMNDPTSSFLSSVRIVLLMRRNVDASSVLAS